MHNVVQVGNTHNVVRIETCIIKKGSMHNLVNARGIHV